MCANIISICERFLTDAHEHEHAYDYDYGPQPHGSIEPMSMRSTWLEPVIVIVVVVVLVLVRYSVNYMPARLRTADASMRTFAASRALSPSS
jgi:hypothetical protein